MKHGDLCYFKLTHENINQAHSDKSNTLLLKNTHRYPQCRMKQELSCRKRIPVCNKSHLRTSLIVADKILIFSSHELIYEFY